MKKALRSPRYQPEICCKEKSLSNVATNLHFATGLAAGQPGAKMGSIVLIKILPFPPGL